VPPPLDRVVGSPKPKKRPGPPWDEQVTIDWNALDAGVTRSFKVKRTYPSKDGKKASSTKEYAIIVRPGEMSGKSRGRRLRDSSAGAERQPLPSR